MEQFSPNQVFWITYVRRYRVEIGDKIDGYFLLGLFVVHEHKGEHSR